MEQNNRKDNEYQNGVNQFSTASSNNMFANNTDVNVSNISMPDVPTTEVEYASGSPDAAGLGFDVPQVAETANIPHNGPTIQQTDYSQATDDDYTQDGLSFQAAWFPSRTDTTTDGQFLDKRPIPFALFRGTTYLSPFGITNALYNGTKIVTKFGDPLVVEQLQRAYSRGTGKLQSNYSLREINNFKSFGEMKDAVESYKGRSIPFTELGQMDMFLLEAAREGRLAICALPLFASKIAKEYMKYLSETGLKFNSDMTAALISTDVSNAEYQIYSVIAQQKTFDPTLWNRIGVMAKLHQSSGKTGFTPQFIVEDLDIALPAFYQPSGRVRNYQVFTPNLNAALCVGPKAAKAWASMTLYGWVALYLGGRKNIDLLLSCLEMVLRLANDTVNGYKIITGNIDMIEGNGGASFNKIGAYLPIKGIHEIAGNAILDFVIEKPCFSYYYKERVEHAPMTASGEYANGNNGAVYETNLFRAPLAFKGSSTKRSSSLKVRRPVGLYKGEKAWTVDEFIYVGLNRRVENTDAQLPLILCNSVAKISNPITNSEGEVSASAYKHVYSQGAGTTLTVTVTFTGDSYSAEGYDGYTGLFIEQVYGDIYLDSVAFTYADNLRGSSVPYYQSRVVHSDLILYAGTTVATFMNPGFPSWMPPLAPQGVYNSAVDVQAWGKAPDGYIVAPIGINYNNKENSNVVGALMAINYMYSWLDISQGCFVTPGSKSGFVDIPVQWFTPYRGALWYDLTTVNIDNIIITMGENFALTYKNNAAVRYVRSQQKANSTPPVSSK